MKKISLKHLLSVFLMVFCFGLTTTITAQADMLSTGSMNAAQINFPKVDKEVVKQSLMQEITTLKTIAKNSSAGSEARVDAMRRIEVFAIAAKALRTGETTRSAYDSGVNHLYYVMHTKEADNAKLAQIRQTLLGFFSN